MNFSEQKYDLQYDLDYDHFVKMIILNSDVQFLSSIITTIDIYI